MAPKSRFAEFEQCSHQASRLAEDGRPCDVLNPDNAMLYHFFRAIKEVASRDVEQGMNKALVLNNKSILKGIAEAPMRIRDGPKLKGIKGIGDQVVKLVEGTLWKHYPPHDPDDEEAEGEQELQAVLARDEAVKKAAAKEQRKHEREAAKAAKQNAAGPAAGAILMAGGGAYGVAPWGVDLDTVFSRSQGAGQGLSQGLNLSQKQSLAMAQPGRGMQLLSQEISPPVAGKPAGVGAGAGRKAAGQGHSKGPRAQVAGGDAVYGVVGLNGAAGGDGSAKKGKKPYVPKVETANYAFLIVMYQAFKSKREPFVKETLMAAADKSGLSCKSIYGNKGTGVPGDSAAWYDGWSSMCKNLMAKDPALVYGYSNPKKVQLTEDGKLLGAQLWMDAHARHKVQPDNFITEAIARADIAHFSDALGLAEDYDVYAKPVKEVKGAGKRKKSAPGLRLSAEDLADMEADELEEYHAMLHRPTGQPRPGGAPARKRQAVPAAAIHGAAVVPPAHTHHPAAASTALLEGAPMGASQGGGRSGVGTMAGAAPMPSQALQQASGFRPRRSAQCISGSSDSSDGDGEGEDEDGLGALRARIAQRLQQEAVLPKPPAPVAAAVLASAYGTAACSKQLSKGALESDGDSVIELISSSDGDSDGGCRRAAPLPAKLRYIKAAAAAAATTRVPLADCTRADANQIQQLGVPKAMPSSADMDCSSLQARLQSKPVGADTCRDAAAAGSCGTSPPFKFNQQHQNSISVLLAGGTAGGLLSRPQPAPQYCFASRAMHAMMASVEDFELMNSQPHELLAGSSRHRLPPAAAAAAVLGQPQRQASQAQVQNLSLGQSQGACMWLPPTGLTAQTHGSQRAGSAGCMLPPAAGGLQPLQRGGSSGQQLAAAASMQRGGSSGEGGSQQQHASQQQTHGSQHSNSQPGAAVPRVTAAGGTLRAGSGGANPAAAGTNISGLAQRAGSGLGAGVAGTGLARAGSAAGVGGSQAQEWSLGVSEPWGSTQASQQSLGVGTSQQGSPPGGGQVLEFEWCLPTLSDMDLDAYAPSASSSAAGTSGGACGMSGFGDISSLRLPPTLLPGQKFGDYYTVAFVMDNREQMSRHSNYGRTLKRGEELETHTTVLKEQGVPVYIDALQVADALWVAVPKDANKQAKKDQWFVLDFCVERKGVSDLASSIVDKRYTRQKFWLMRSGLQRPMYLVEGRPDDLGSMEAKRVKTASYSTDLEGLILIRTNDHRDTLSKYEQLHRAIERAYRNRTAPAERMPAEALYGPLETFRAWAQRMRQVKEGMRVDQLWGLMLCQVPGVGEEVVGTIRSKYPTPQALARAYQETIQAALVRGGDGVSVAQGLLTGLPGVGPVRSRAVYDHLFSYGANFML